VKGLTLEDIREVFEQRSFRQCVRRAREIQKEMKESGKHVHVDPNTKMAAQV